MGMTRHSNPRKGYEIGFLLLAFHDVYVCVCVCVYIHLFLIINNGGRNF